MIQFLTRAIADIEAVVLAAIAAAAAVSVASVWWRTKALVPTLTSIILAAVVVWAAGNVDQLESRVAEDSTQWLEVGP